MRRFHFIFSRLAFFISMAIASPSCHSVDDQVVNPEIIQQVLDYYLPGSYHHRGKSEPIFKQADLNGDGRQDLVILITPVELPINNKQIVISQPWNPSGTQGVVKALSKSYRTSILILQPSGPDWLAEDTRVDLLVDTQGVMETPSFELLVKPESTPQAGTGDVPVREAESYDVLILPTEAGIDTYIYWSGSGFNFYQPEEIP